jgi:hypothetical protein
VVLLAAVPVVDVVVLAAVLAAEPRSSSSPTVTPVSLLPVERRISSLPRT